MAANSSLPPPTKNSSIRHRQQGLPLIRDSEQPGSTGHTSGRNIGLATGNAHAQRRAERLVNMEGVVPRVNANHQRHNIIPGETQILFGMIAIKAITYLMLQFNQATQDSSIEMKYLVYVFNFFGLCVSCLLFGNNMRLVLQGFNNR